MPSREKYRPAQADRRADTSIDRPMRFFSADTNAPVLQPLRLDGRAAVLRSNDTGSLSFNGQPLRAKAVGYTAADAGPPRAEAAHGGRAPGAQSLSVHESKSRRAAPPGLHVRAGQVDFEDTFAKRGVFDQRYRDVANPFVGGAAPGAARIDYGGADKFARAPDPAAHYNNLRGGARTEAFVGYYGGAAGGAADARRPYTTYGHQERTEWAPRAGVEAFLGGALDGACNSKGMTYKDGRCVPEHQGGSPCAMPGWEFKDGRCVPVRAA
jgi:hypothetical protein